MSDSNKDCPPVLPITPGTDEGVTTDGTTDGTVDGTVDTGRFEERVAEQFEEGEIIVPTQRPRALGKMRMVVDAETYQNIPAQKSRQGITPFAHRTRDFAGPWDQFQTTVSDRFRHVIGAHWGIKNRFNEDGRRITEKFAFINPEFFNPEIEGNSAVSYANGIPFTLTTFAVQDDDRRSTRDITFLRDFYKKQTISLRAMTEQFRIKTPPRGAEFSPAFWDAWVLGGWVTLGGDNDAIEGQNFPPLFKTGETYFDHACRLSVPLFPQETQKLNGFARPAIAKVDMEYNFYVKEYEEILAQLLESSQDSEPLLPNLYVFLSEKKSANLDSDNSLFHQLITLSGVIRDVSVDVLNEKGEKIGEKDKGQYFDKWGRGYLRASSLEKARWGSLKNKYKRLIFSPLDMENFSSFNDKRFLFPMYVDLEFSTDRTTRLAEALKESQLSSSLMKMMSKGPIVAAPAYAPKSRSFRIATELISSSSGFGSGDLAINKIIGVSQPQQRTILDLVEWWEAFSKDEIHPVWAFADYVLLGSSLPEVFVTSDQQYKFVQTILSMVFSGKIRSILKDRLRSFRDIMTGKFAYSETIFYKISKHNIDDVTGELSPSIQDFFVPNSSELDVFRFIDTQVIFNKEYRYIVHAYEMVFGTAYEYVPNWIYKDANGQIMTRTTSNPPQGEVFVDVYTRPSLKIIEIPYFEFTTQISDKAPLPPQVEIIPYRGVNNRVLINLNAETGEMKAQPIAFSPEEVKKNDKYRVRHDLQPNAPLEYKGDDTIDFFEVYRTETKPTSYDDLKDNFHRDVDTKILASRPGDTGVEALSSASLRDGIRPNVKYYYTFRAVDIHGNVSNPSPVFLVEMVDQSGMVYPIITTYEFEKPKSGNLAKDFKKYLHILPAGIQGEINITSDPIPESAIDAKVKIGSRDESLFAEYPQERKVKFRVTSKQTGKKIDINLKFTHKHIE